MLLVPNTVLSTALLTERLRGIWARLDPGFRRRCRAIPDSPRLHTSLNVRHAM